MAEALPRGDAGGSALPHFYFTVPATVHGHHAQPYMSMTSAAGFPTGHAPNPRHFQCRGCGSVGTSCNLCVALSLCVCGCVCGLTLFCFVYVWCVPSCDTAEGSEHFLVAVRSVVRYYEAKAAVERKAAQERLAKRRRTMSAVVSAFGSAAASKGASTPGQWDGFSSPYDFAGSVQPHGGGSGTTPSGKDAGAAALGGEQLSAKRRATIRTLGRKLELDIVGGSFSSNNDRNRKALEDAGLRYVVWCGVV